MISNTLKAGTFLCLGSLLATACTSIDRGPVPLGAEMGARSRSGSIQMNGGVSGDIASTRTQGSESYTPTQTRIVKDVRDEPLSTFSIDVDTASYSIVRRMLREGRRIPKFAVRPEEFLNYFDYGYQGPTDDLPFAVQSEIVESPYSQGKHFLRIGVQGKKIRAEERKPVCLVFLVDVSGSMHSPDKLGLVKRSLRMLLGTLREGDSVALCTYAGRVAKILGPTGMDQKGDIHEAIENLSAGGSTAMGSGLELAYKLAAQNTQRGAISRVIVCSDGDANVGNTGHSEILKSIEAQREKGVTLSTIGFGMGNYKDVMMEQLADKGNGNCYYIDSDSQARRVFQEEAAGTLQVIAKDVKIQVEFGEGVKSYRLIGYENRDLKNEDFTDDKVDAGEIGAGHRVTAVYEVTLGDPKKDLAKIRLRYKQPDGDKSTEMEAQLDPDIKSFDAASGSFKFCAAVVGFAEILRQSPHASEWTLEMVQSCLQGAQIPSNRDKDEFRDLVAKARELLGQRS
ncbi:MAG: von Willebrand factor type A domain-containing protein [Planctomycetota bacterium]|nr:von Willebrand factor type A domain-containing protein [Planctomycetota bacterium]